MPWELICRGAECGHSPSGSSRAESGTSRSTIYYYVRAGLLPPAQKSSPTRALYTDDHVELLDEIHRLKRQGLDIRAIREQLQQRVHEREPERRGPRGAAGGGDAPRHPRARRHASSRATATARRASPTSSPSWASRRRRCTATSRPSATCSPPPTASTSTASMGAIEPRLEGRGRPRRALALAHGRRLQPAGAQPGPSLPVPRGRLRRPGDHPRAAWCARARPRRTATGPRSVSGREPDEPARFRTS